MKKTGAITVEVKKYIYILKCKIKLPSIQISILLVKDKTWKFKYYTTRLTSTA